jgi:hypothetical protein
MDHYSIPVCIYPANAEDRMQNTDSLTGSGMLLLIYYSAVNSICYRLCISPDPKKNEQFRWIAIVLMCAFTLQMQRTGRGT